MRDKLQHPPQRDTDRVGSAYIFIYVLSHGIEGEGRDQRDWLARSSDTIRVKNKIGFAQPRLLGGAFFCLFGFALLGFALFHACEGFAGNGLFVLLVQRRARAGLASGRASCWWSRFQRDCLAVLKPALFPPRWWHATDAGSWYATSGVTRADAVPGWAPCWRRRRAGKVRFAPC